MLSPFPSDEEMRRARIPGPPRYERSFLATLLALFLLLTLSRTTLLLPRRSLRLLLPLLLLLWRRGVLLRGDVGRRRVDIRMGFVADRGGTGGRGPHGSVNLGMLRRGRRRGSLTFSP